MLNQGDPTKKLRVCLQTHDFWLNGRLLMLARKETDVLMKLIQHRGRTTPIDSLLALWDEDDIYDERQALQNIMCRLRARFGKHSIATRTNVGYVLTMEVEIIKDGVEESCTQSS